MRLTLLFTCSLIFGSPAFAHDFWLEPSTFSGEKAEIVLREGVDMKGESLPYIPVWFSDFSQLANDDRDTVQSIPGDDPAATVRLAEGLNILGYQSRPVFAELDAEKFREYLLDEGMDYIVADREARGESADPAPENFVRCAKSLLRNGDATQGPAHDSVLGYTLELIPEQNPYTLGAGEELSVRLLYDGAPIAGVMIRAFTRDEPSQVQSQRSDADGRVTFTLDDTGFWLIKGVHMVRLPEGARLMSGQPVYWESYWASLTFELPPG